MTRAANLDRFSVWRAPLSRDGNFTLAANIQAGNRSRIRGYIIRRAQRDDFAAMRAGAGPEIDNVVRASDGFFVVLDDQDRVAEIAQRRKRV